MYVHLYIYIYIHSCIYIYIYKYIRETKHFCRLRLLRIFRFIVALRT